MIAAQASFLGEVGITGNYQLTSWLAFRTGYDLLWLAEVALAPHQTNNTDLGNGLISVDTVATCLPTVASSVWNWCTNRRDVCGHAAARVAWPPDRLPDRSARLRDEQSSRRRRSVLSQTSRLSWRHGSAGIPTQTAS